MAKAVSTLVFDGCVFFVRLCLFILVGNPLSMWFYNLLFPREAAEFAKNSHIFGEQIYSFYEYFALKWPFHWAKWWMKPENLSKYSVDRQIQYLFKMAFRNQTEIEALKAMQKGKGFWPDAYEKLFFVYGQKWLPLKRKDMKNRDSRPKWYSHSVAEFMMQNVRLSYNALDTVIKKSVIDSGLRSSLSQYLASGKLCDAQFSLLVDSVTTDKHSGDLQMLKVLLDYIERYGVSENELGKIKEQYPKPFFELVTDANTLYEQMRVHKAFKDTPDGRNIWKLFCQKTPKVLSEVQSLMSLPQYEIFHQVGHNLDEKAIENILLGGDKNFIKAVFLNEKACRSGKLREFIRQNAALELEYRDIVTVKRKGK